MQKQNGRPKNRFIVKRGAIPPSAALQHVSDTQWEEFIEAACRLRQGPEGSYFQVKRLGNAGDKGRDIEARLVQDLLPEKWDLYQGKHYANRLTPGDAFPELAKFFGHLSKKSYPQPRRYFFCAPQNCGPDLHDLLANPPELKRLFIEAWTKGSYGLKTAELTPEVLLLVKNFDFARVRECLVRDLLQWHARDSKVHHELFGIEPERGADPDIPAKPADHEAVYVTELLRVYSEDHNSDVQLSVEQVEALASYVEHFAAARAAFYCAEGLKRFSRDLYVDDEFGALLNMVYTGIRPSLTSPALKSGLARLDRALEAAGRLTLTDSRLWRRLRGGDLPGTCHHLVNEKKIRWVR